ncbi:hypothetical protein JTB14_030548 [Gonioctena quinquepunctata]|nr:hypothetical protein JTB14_030548 [Gonioctena quinquepunctata]
MKRIMSPSLKVSKPQQLLFSNDMNKFRTLLKKSLATYPILTNSLIYGSLCTASEFSQQTINKILVDDPKPLDSRSIGRYVIYGTCIGGPLIAVWYRNLDKWFQGTATKVIVKKLMVDQFTFTASLLVVFYVSMSLMERKADIFQECREKFVPTFQTSWLRTLGCAPSRGSIFYVS